MIGTSSQLRPQLPPKHAERSSLAISVSYLDRLEIGGRRRWLGLLPQHLYRYVQHTALFSFFLQPIPTLCTPVSWENGDPPKWGPGGPIFPGVWGPGSPFSWENGDPGSPFSLEYGDPLSENGDPLYDRWLTVRKWRTNTIIGLRRQTYARP